MNYKIFRENQASDEQGSPVWAERTLHQLLFQAYQDQKRARMWKGIWRALILLVVVVLFVLLMYGNGNNHKDSLPLVAKAEHTAVVRLEGVIEVSEYRDPVEVLRDGMKKAYENHNAKAIVIVANSPGGSPVLSNIAFNEIRHLKKQHEDIPVYVVAEDVCASGCYYIAAVADQIFADPSSLVGSIGVIASGFDATGLMEKLGVKRRVRIAGNNKDMGDPFVPETPQQQAIWQQMLDQTHEQFIKAVREGRGARLLEKENPDLFSGRIYTGIEAKKVGLIDEYGSVYSVARDVVKAPELVDYTPKQNDLARLFGRFGVELKQQIKNSLLSVW